MMNDTNNYLPTDNFQEIEDTKLQEELHLLI